MNKKTSTVPEAPETEHRESLAVREEVRRAANAESMLEMRRRSQEQFASARRDAARSTVALARARESLEASLTRREQDRQMGRDRLRISPFNSLRYIDIGEMSVQCQHCGAMLEPVNNS